MLRPLALKLYHKAPLAPQAKLRIKSAVRAYESAKKFGESTRNSLEAGMRVFFQRQATNKTISKELFKLLDLVSSHAQRHGTITHVFALPFMGHGGAEKVVRNIANCLARTHRNSASVVVTTERDAPFDVRDFPETTMVVNMKRDISTMLNETESQQLLNDFITAIEPQVFHIINSDTAWHMLNNFEHKYKYRTKIFGSIFAFQFSPDMKNKIGFADQFLLNALPRLNGLITDNHRFVEMAIDEYGLTDDSAKKFHVVYQSTEKSGYMPEQSRQRITSIRRYVWAGRLDAEKRIDMLMEIATQMPRAEFHVYGKHVVDRVEILNTSYPSNVIYKGGFNNVRELTLGEPYDAFLFTSRWEGLPNILLEVGELGIPIVAVDVGGVSELISQETGYLISSSASAKDYVSALEEMSINRNEVAKRALSLQKLIWLRHSTEAFEVALKNVDGYLSNESASSNSTITNDCLTSAIIPCFNQGKYIFQAVSSLIMATARSLEVIIVDDGSTDPSTARYLSEIQAHYPSLVKVVQKGNGGLSSARNAGIAQARGQFIQFLDADDLLLKHKIDAQIDQLTCNEKIDVSICDYLLCDEKVDFLSQPINPVRDFTLDLNDFLFHWERGLSIPIHCALFRRASLGNLRFDETLQAKEDWFFWTSAAHIGMRISRLPGALAVYRQHSASMRRSHLKMGFSWLQAGQKIQQLVGVDRLDFHRSYTDWFANFYHKHASLQDLLSVIPVSSDATGIDAKANMQIERITSLLESHESSLHLSDLLLTVIIPVHNHFDYLLSCLNSVLEQKCNRFHIVCINDGSNDPRIGELFKHLSKVAKQNVFVNRNVNRGICYTQNEAISLAQGRYCAFLDCDDALNSDALQVISDEINSHPSIDYFFSDRVDVDVRGRRIRVARYGGYDDIHFRGHEFIAEDLERGMIASHLKVIRTDCLNRLGGFDARYEGVQDWALALDMAQSFRFRYIPQAIYLHRSHTSSVTRSSSTSQFRLSNVLLREKVFGRFQSENAVEARFDANQFPRKTDSLRAAKKSGMICVVDFGEVVAPDSINCVREHNALIDKICVENPKTTVQLLGYLWSTDIVMDSYGITK
jgi:glycosyltransferase involved in cell wall biosynthesis